MTPSPIPSSEPISNEDFTPAIDPGDRRQSFIPKAISPATRLRIHHTSTSSVYYTYPFSLRSTSICSTASIHIPRMHEQRTLRAPSLASHTRTNPKASTNPFFRGAYNVQVTGTPTFNTIIDGIVVESRTYGPGPIGIGIGISPGQSSTAHQDSDQSRRLRYDPPCTLTLI